MDMTHRRNATHYKVTAHSKFSVRCDPPYESEDGGEDETLVTVTRDDVHRTITDLCLANMARLATDQTPMIIEIRRVS